MHSVEISILKTVAYFDVFSYPLTSGEINFFLDQKTSEESFDYAIENLIQTRQLWKFEDFYSLRNDVSLIERREKGNKLAGKQIKKAKAVAAFLWWMPYIKGIAISGSLSKNFADENSDLDFFIITAANRLWIVRILYAMLFKMASGINLKHWFCLNYFIDELNLEIADHNLFTAVEISTLKPLKGKLLFENFFQHNDWANELLPNHKPDFSHLKKSSQPIIKRLPEWLFKFKHGNKLDDKLHLFFKKRFDRMVIENIKTEKGLTIGAYEADKHACRPLPQYFQPIILGRFNDIFNRVKKNYHQHTIIKENVLSNE